MAETEERQDREAPDVVTMAHRFYREARDHSSNWRSEAETWYDMVSGEQWDQADLDELRNQQRPAVVFNRILRTVNAISGTQVSNRQETRYIPREVGDVQLAEVLTAAADWVRDKCDAEDEESDAFRDMCVVGMGFTETRLSFEDNQDGDLVIEKIDPLEMYWDPGSRRRNLADARWIMHVKVMSLSEFQEAWPDAELDLAAAPWEGSEDDVSRRVHVYPQDAYREAQSRRHGGKMPTVRVAHVQWAETRESYRVGRRAEKLDAGRFEKLRQKLDERKISYMRQPVVVWRRAFIAGGALLDEGECPYPRGPTLRCMTYERDRNRGTWFGVVKAMMDPQRFGNKFFSQILDILNKGAKGGIMAEVDAVEDFRELESKWARPDSVIKVRSGALAGGKIKEKPLVQLPPGLDRLMTFSMDAVHEVTGINLELLGFANREQAGVLESQRKQAGLTIIASLFDALRKYRKEQGRVMLHHIQEYLSDDRLIRIVGGDGKERYVPLAKQPEVAEYDVIVDESPTSPNMKERVYGALVEILPALLKFGAPMPPELLDYAPIPSALAEKWKEMIRSSPGDPEQTQRMIEEGQKKLAQLTDENAKLKDKRAESAANLQLKAAEQSQEIELKRQEAGAEIELKRAEAEAALALQAQKQQAELELERLKIQGQMDCKRQELGLKHQIDSNQLVLDHQPALTGLTEILEKIAERVEEQGAFLAGDRRIVLERGADDLITGAKVTGANGSA